MTTVNIHFHLPQQLDSSNHDQLAASTMSAINYGAARVPELEWSPTLCGKKRVKYAVAEKAVAALGPEWRIPTDKDWDTVIDRSKYNPAIDTDQVPAVALGYHWTSTPCPWSSGSAVFVVNTSSGGVDGDRRYDVCFVRAVRAVPGQ